MFLLVFTLLRPSKKLNEDVVRWTKKDEIRLGDYRNYAIDKHEPFM